VESGTPSFRPKAVGRLSSAYTGPMAECRAPVWLTLLVGAVAVASAWSLRKPLTVVDSSAAASTPAGMDGRRLAAGIGAVVEIGGLPPSIVLRPHPSTANQGVSLNSADNGHRFALVDWIRYGDAYDFSVDPDPDSAKIRRGGIFAGAAQEFFSDEKVGAAIGLDSRIDWSTKGDEVEFFLYPHPETEPLTAIGLRFVFVQMADTVIGRRMARSAAHGWTRVGEDIAVEGVEGHWTWVPESSFRQSAVKFGQQD
jgi:hypothetical protein